MSFAVRRAAPVAVRVRASQRRMSSSDAHHDDHHIASADDAQYQSKETFFSRPFIYTIFAGAGIAAFYKWAPEPGQDAYLSRYIAHWITPRDRWIAANDRHMAKTQAVAEEILVLESAQKSQIHRYRYPQMLDQASTHSVPVGPRVDMSTVVVKQ